MIKKFTFLLSFIFLFSTNLIASDAPQSVDGLIDSIKKNKFLRDLAFQSVLGTRCESYLPFDQGRACSFVTAKMISMLDYDVIFIDDKTPEHPDDSWRPTSFVFVAFKQNLLSLLAAKNTSNYLNDLNQSLTDYMLGKLEKFSFWDLTKKYFKSDYSASLAIATLFQDTSMMKLHIAYLNKVKTGSGINFSSNKELLSRVIETINWAMDTAQEDVKEIFYPHELAPNLSRRIYHYYVPKFLSLSLNKEKINKQYSALAPLMMTLSYEFLTASKDYRYIFSDPEFIRDLEKIKDIYAGYCGANHGVRGLDFNYSFETIRSEFERSTWRGIRTLIRH